MPRERSYVLRLHETGRDAQPGRQKVRRDIVNVLRRRIPGASIETRPGRVVLTCERDAAPILRELHGVLSYSAAERCAPERAIDRAVAFAGHAMAARGPCSFRVRARVRGSKAHGARATEVELGSRICDSVTGARVDLARPDIEVGVEIYDRDAFVFGEVVLGVDRTGPAPPASGPPRFLVDHMLGALVGWLRLLGYDTTFARHEPDSELLRRARTERRVVLTRDRELSRATSARVYLVASLAPEQQLADVATTFGLSFSPARMFTRCCECNRSVEPASDAAIARRVPSEIRDRYRDYTYCPACDKVYWEGPQHARIVDTLARLLHQL